MNKVVLLFLLIATIGHGQTGSENSEGVTTTGTTTTLEGWETISTSSYSLQFPPDWEYSNSGLMGTSFILFSPMEDDMDLFKENVNLLIQDLSAYNMNLDQYVILSEAQIQSVIPNSRFLESERRSFESGEYHRVLYTGDQGFYHLTFEQYYWIENQQAYIMTFTTEQDKYELFKEEGQKILNSFKLK